MKKKDIIAAILLVVALTIWALMQMNSEKRKFKKDGLLTQGTINSVQQDYKGRVVLYYSYSVFGESFTESTAYPELSFKIQNALLHKTFPVIYLKKNPKKSKILVTEMKFKRFGYSFPDSLKWIEPFVIKQ